MHKVLQHKLFFTAQSRVLSPWLDMFSHLTTEKRRQLALKGLFKALWLFFCNVSAHAPPIGGLVRETTLLHWPQNNQRKTNPLDLLIERRTTTKTINLDYRKTQSQNRVDTQNPRLWGGRTGSLHARSLPSSHPPFFLQGSVSRCSALSTPEQSQREQERTGTAQGIYKNNKQALSDIGL